MNVYASLKCCALFYVATSARFASTTRDIQNHTDVTIWQNSITRRNTRHTTRVVTTRVRTRCVVRRVRRQNSAGRRELGP